MSYLRIKHPDALVFAIPNGGKRHPSVAAKLKMEGVLAGVPDLWIEGSFLEIKTEKGRLSPAQKDIIKRLRDRGITVEVAYGLNDAIKKAEETLRGTKNDRMV